MYDIKRETKLRNEEFQFDEETKWICAGSESNKLFESFEKSERKNQVKLERIKILTWWNISLIGRRRETAKDFFTPLEVNVAKKAWIETILVLLSVFLPRIEILDCVNSYKLNFLRCRKVTKL